MGFLVPHRSTTGGGSKLESKVHITILNVLGSTQEALFAEKQNNCWGL